MLLTGFGLLISHCCAFVVKCHYYWFQFLYCLLQCFITSNSMIFLLPFFFRPIYFLVTCITASTPLLLYAAVIIRCYLGLYISLLCSVLWHKLFSLRCWNLGLTVGYKQFCAACFLLSARLIEQFCKIFCIAPKTRGILHQIALICPIFTTFVEL